MDCGKSTLALQMNYNHGRQGRRGLVLTKHDRSGGPKVTSRIGLGLEAIEVEDSSISSGWSPGTTASTT
ncbi:hypothetical protein ACFQ0B_29940 [Nonomuraea thailandensis]